MMFVAVRHYRECRYSFKNGRDELNKEEANCIREYLEEISTLDLNSVEFIINYIGNPIDDV